MMRRAQAVMVNDPISAAEVVEVAQREPISVPMFVDATYFSPSPPNMRGHMLFCPGSNDRDPTVLTALANAGLDVVWLCNDLALAAAAIQEAPRLTIVSRISFAALRHHYATCAAVVTPLNRDLHAAGQTTGLEALASGAPLLLSPGRTSALLSEFPGVRVVDGSTQRWIEAARSILHSPPSPATLAAGADAAAAHVDPQAFMMAYDEVFATAGVMQRKV